MTQLEVIDGERISPHQETMEIVVSSSKKQELYYEVDEPKAKSKEPEIS